MDDIQTLKIDLIHWLTELQDPSILKKLQVLKEKQETINKLNSEQKNELDKRLLKKRNQIYMEHIYGMKSKDAD